jgi:hypothetical protein
LKTAAILVDRAVDSEAIQARFVALSRQTPDAIRAAAARIWPRLFSIDLPDLQPAGTHAAPKR